MYDGLGSVVATVDATGAVTSARKYDVYGSVRALTGLSGTKHKFEGSLGHPSEGETGLVYMRARYYDPVVGRFASEDPVRDGKNWFLYASAKPSRNVDPTGKESLVSVTVSNALTSALFRIGRQLAFDGSIDWWSVGWSCIIGTLAAGLASAIAEEFLMAGALSVGMMGKGVLTW